MSTPFTPEQEARIAQIVGEVMLAVERQRQTANTCRSLDDLDTAISWALERGRPDV